MEQPLILVTGATGTSGREVVKQLVERGQRVRALARDPAKANSLGREVEIVIGDLTKPETLGPAFAGVNRALVVANGLELATLEANAFAAAKQAGVKHIVKMSGRHLDAAFTVGSPFARMHGESESRLRALGTRWTILRPGTFASNLLLWLNKETGELFLPVGDGWDVFTDPRDIAAVAVHVLTTPGHDGATYEITGPEPLRYAEAVRKMAEAIGRPLRLVDVPQDTARTGLIAAGVPIPQAETLLRHFDGVRSGQIYPPTMTITELLGRPARTFDDWLRDHVTDLRTALTSPAHATIAPVPGGRLTTS